MLLSPKVTVTSSGVLVESAPLIVTVNRPSSSTSVLVTLKESSAFEEVIRSVSSVSVPTPTRSVPEFDALNISVCSKTLEVRPEPGPDPPPPGEEGEGEEEDDESLSLSHPANANTAIEKITTALFIYLYGSIMENLIFLIVNY
jgi:hypothetical protein